MVTAATPATGEQVWTNRIVGYGQEAPDQLLANPNNVRIHPLRQQQAMGEVLAEVGVVQNVIVNQRTGFVVDGHMRVQLALSAGQPWVPVTYVDLDEDEELLVLHTFDPLASLAAYDRDMLAENAPDVLAKAAASHVLATFFEELVAANAPPPAELPFALPLGDGNPAGEEQVPVPGVDEAPAAPADADPAPSHVKMVQLFFTTESHPVFMTQVSALMAAWGKDNVTDVVAEAVARAYAAVPADADQEDAGEA